MVLAVVGIFLSLGLGMRTPTRAYAATQNTVNFQARLQTAAGAIVPDGNYNVEFKLYNTDTGGTALWTEDYFNENSTGVRVVNGYLSVNLGSVTAFTTNINWDQQLWLTMNIGGTSAGAPTMDGEMNPRLKLTAVPYAFSAGKLSQYNSTTGFTSTLNMVQPTVGDQIFQIPDQGAAGTFNILTQNTADNRYIQLQSSPPGTAQTGYFNISGTGTANTFNASSALQTAGVTRIDSSGNLTNIGNVTASGNLQQTGSGATNYLMGALGLGTTNPQTGSALTVANGKWISSVDAAGTGYINMFTVNSSNQIQVGASLNVDGSIVLPTNGGQVTFSDLPIDISAASGTKESYTMRVGSTNALTVYGEADGAGNAQNVRVAIGNSIAPGYTLDVGGDINSTGSYRVNGAQGATTTCSGGQVLQNQVVQGGIVTGVTCAAPGASGTFVTLQSTVPGTTDHGNFNIDGTGIAGSLQSSSLDTASVGGTLSLGTANASNITVGSASSTGTLTLGQSTGTNTINIGNAQISDGNTETINVGTQAGGTGKTVVTIGSTHDGSSLTLQAGTGGVSLGDGGSANTIQIGNSTGAVNQTLNIGTNATAGSSTTLTVGSKQDGSTTTLQAGNGGLSLVTSGGVSGVFVKNTANTTTGFMIQNSDSQSLLTADTTHATNLLNNSGFDTGMGDWTAIGAGASISRTATASNIYAGSGALAVQLGSGSGTGAEMTSANFGGGSVAAGSYALSFYAYGSTAITGLAVSFNGGGTCTLSSTSVSVSGYQRYSCTVTTTGPTTAIDITATTTSSTLYLDSVQLQTGSSVTNYMVGTLHLNGVIGSPMMLQNGVDSTSAFQVQNAAGTSLLTADTLNGTITIGTGTNGVVLSASGITLNGTAQHSKRLVLAPEYAGAVLDSTGDSSCNSANSGTLTSAYDAVSNQNYYNWTASAATSQCYDVVVQVAVPSDFAGWASTDPINVQAKTDSTSNSAVAIEVLNAAGTPDTNYGSSYTTGSLSTSWGDVAGSSFGSSYSAGSVMTLRIRMSASNASNLQLGTITLNYKSQY